jgi:hypothetical protein
MFEMFASIVALCSLGVSAVLAFRFRALSDRLAAAERQLSERGAKSPVLAEVDRRCEGLRIALRVEQDHPHPIFVGLLKELFLREDAVLGTNEPDLLVTGRIVCNGYADVYYTAELTCLLREEPICVLIEKPPHGDRQENLARELVAKLTKELGKTVRRTERHAALRELEQP